jgi:hypothetical protein
MFTEANGVDGIVVADPPTDQEIAVAASRGTRSLATPYFAMWMQNPGAFVEFGGFFPLWTIIAAFNSPPPLIGTVDDPHYFASYHEIGGVELFSIGVTSDLRLCAKTSVGQLFYSAPGVVQPDGVAHAYQLQVLSTAPTGHHQRAIKIDDLIVAFDDRLNGNKDGLISPTGLPTRVMLFNGVEGRSLIDCTIFEATITNGLDTLVWSLPGGVPGSVASDPASLADQPGADFTLTAGYYDPSPLYPLLLGPIPSDPVSSAFARVLDTQYTKRTIVTPNYQRAGATA